MINKEYSNKKFIYLMLMVSIALTTLFSLFMLFIDIRLATLSLVCGIVFSILIVGIFVIFSKIIKK